MQRSGANPSSACKRCQVENIIVTDVRTEICILATTERSFAEGFRTFVVSDLVGTYDDKQLLADSVLDALRYSAYVVASRELLENISNRGLLPEHVRL